jgi:hypothetical protein
MTALAPERLRCMVLATWYPSEADPVDRVFVHEAVAVRWEQTYRDVVAAPRPA